MKFVFPDVSAHLGRFAINPEAIETIQLHGSGSKVIMASGQVIEVRESVDKFLERLASTFDAEDAVAPIDQRAAEPEPEPEPGDTYDVVAAKKADDLAKVPAELSPLKQRVRIETESGRLLDYVVDQIEGLLKWARRTQANLPKA